MWPTSLSTMPKICFPNCKTVFSNFLLNTLSLCRLKHFNGHDIVRLTCGEKKGHVFHSSYPFLNCVCRNRRGSQSRTGHSLTSHTHVTPENICGVFLREAMCLHGDGSFPGVVMVIHQGLLVLEELSSATVFSCDSPSS